MPRGVCSFFHSFVLTLFIFLLNGVQSLPKKNSWQSSWPVLRWGQLFYPPDLSFFTQEMEMKIFIMGCCDIERRSWTCLAQSTQLTFLPSVGHHSIREPTILALTGTSSQPCLAKADPLLPSLFPSPYSPFLAFPQKAPGLLSQWPNHRILGLACRDPPSPLPPSTLSPV